MSRSSHFDAIFWYPKNKIVHRIFFPANILNKVILATDRNKDINKRKMRFKKVIIHYRTKKKPQHPCSSRFISLNFFSKCHQRRNLSSNCNTIFKHPLFETAREELFNKNHQSFNLSLLLLSKVLRLDSYFAWEVS